MARDCGDQLTELRARIDDLDAQLVELLARRFTIPREIGRLKADRDLPSLDERRESAQRERLRTLASESGIDPEMVLAVFEAVVARVRAEHEAVPRGAVAGALDEDPSGRAR